MAPDERSLTAERSADTGFAQAEQRIEVVKSQMLSGSIWMVTMRWAIRAIGLVSTLVLVRVLAPADFGILAIATMVTGMFEVFAETGQKLAIIRHEQVTRPLLDSAFTVQVAVCTSLSVLVFLTAPFARMYFNEPHADDVIRLLALRPLLMGLENIGTVAFRRDLDFAKEFRYGVFQKLGTASLTILLALILENYWALAIGIVAGQASAVAISYRMHPYRPSLSLEKVREIWGFSIWMLAGHVAIFVQTRIDQFALGGAVDAVRLGKYAVGVDVSTMPTTELVLPAGRALYPAFTRLASRPLELKGAYLSSLAALAVICWSAGVGLAVVSRDFTLVVLGKRWADLAPIVPWASLAAALFALSNTVLTVHQAAGRARTFALQTWLRVLLFAPLAFLAAQSGNLERVVEARFIVTVIWVPLLFISLRAVFEISVLDILRTNWRPAMASAVMAAAVLAATTALSAFPSYARLCINVTLGAALFVSSQIALWVLAGKPFGIERSMIDWLSGKRAKVDATD